MRSSWPNQGPNNGNSSLHQQQPYHQSQHHYHQSLNQSIQPQSGALNATNQISRKILSSTKSLIKDTFQSMVNHYSLGNPADIPSVLANGGEGSSFLSLPTKKNSMPYYNPPLQQASESRRSSVASVGSSFSYSGVNQSPGRASSHYLNFKNHLLPWIQKASSSEEFTGSEFTEAASSLLPTDQQWYALNQLRIHAGAPEMSERGADQLMNYYSQLCWLEERFPLETNGGSIHLPFQWYEAFHVKSKMKTNCIQYEKASVMWNLAALYSQLGARKCLWSVDGLKQAALCFQKSAGCLRHIRDHLFPRFNLTQGSNFADQSSSQHQSTGSTGTTGKINQSTSGSVLVIGGGGGKSKLDASSDLSDLTLTVAIDLMLAQAAECFYMKAEFDNTSSPVTSQIATQAADYYDIAHKANKQNNSFAKSRFPKLWSSWMNIKKLSLLALANYHCPNMLSSDVAVGERHARLLLASQQAQQALDKCLTKESIIPREIKVFAETTLNKVTAALEQVDRANFEDFHQPVLPISSLKPLRRPPQTLVSPIDLISGDGSGTMYDQIRLSKIRDIFDGVIGVMGLSSGYRSGLPEVGSGLVDPCQSEPLRFCQKNTPGYAISDSMGHENQISERRVEDSAETGEANQHSPFQSPSRQWSARSSVDQTRRESISAQLSPIAVEEVKKVILEVKKETKDRIEALRNDLDCIRSTVDGGLSVNQTTEPIQQLLSRTIQSCENHSSIEKITKRSRNLIAQYVDCEKLNRAVSIDEIDKTLEDQLDWCIDYLSKVHEYFWKNSTSSKNASGLRKNSINARETEYETLKQLSGTVSSSWFDSDASNKFSSIRAAKFNFADDPGKIRSDSQNLLLELHDEGLKDLFTDMKGKVKDVDGQISESLTADQQLNWTKNKVKTVIPCLDSDFQKRHSDATNIVNALWSTMGGAIACSRLPSDLYSSFALITERYLELRDKCIFSEGEVRERLSELREMHSKWCGNVDSSFSVGSSGGKFQSKTQIIDMLESMGKNSLRQSDSESKEDLILGGIRVLRQNLSELVEASDVVIKGFDQTMRHISYQTNTGKPIQHLSDSKNIPDVSIGPDIRELANVIHSLSIDSQNSEKITQLFEDQLSKFKQWRRKAEIQVDKLGEFKKWLADTYGNYVGKNFFGQSTMESYQITGLESSPKQIEQARANFERRQIDEGRKIRQLSRTFANEASMMAKKYDKEPQPGSRRISAFERNQDDLSRSQMLRNISVAASQLESNARDLRRKSQLDSKEDSPTSYNVQMRQARNEVLGQISELQIHQTDLHKKTRRESRYKAQELMKESGMRRGSTLESRKSSMQSATGNLIARKPVQVPDEKEYLEPKPLSSSRNFVAPSGSVSGADNVPGRRRSSHGSIGFAGGMVGGNANRRGSMMNDHQAGYFQQNIQDLSRPYNVKSATFSKNSPPKPSLSSAPRSISGTTEIGTRDSDFFVSSIPHRGSTNLLSNQDSVIGLKKGMDSVSKYFAWNNAGSTSNKNFDIHYQPAVIWSDQQQSYANRRMRGLGGDPHIP